MGTCLRRSASQMIRWIALAFLSLVLLSCSGPAPTTMPAPTATATAIELRVFTARDPLAGQALEIAANGFAGLHPEARTTILYAEADPVAQLKALAAGSTAPDVIWMAGAQVQSLASAGLLMDMQDLARLDRNVDPRNPEGCSCVRPPPPFRLTNITSEALSASRSITGSGLYMIPALITGTLSGPPLVAGFGIAASTRQIEVAWAFVRYMATADGQAAIVARKLGRPVLRSLADRPDH